MTFDPQAAGNKGIKAPRIGYEQRLVSYKNYNTAQIKGWAVRKEGGEVHKGGAVLCERFVGGIPDAIPESLSEDVINGEPSVNILLTAVADDFKIIDRSLPVDVIEQDVVETLGMLSTVSPVDAVIAAIGDAAKEIENSLYGKSIIASDEFVKSQLERTAEIRNIVDELNAEKVIPVKTKKNKGKK